MKHIDQFQPSYYQFESTKSAEPNIPRKCTFMLCQMAVTWWIAECCCNVPSSLAPVHTGTKSEVARISKKFRHFLANFGGGTPSSRGART